MSKTTKTTRKPTPAAQLKLVKAELLTAQNELSAQKALNDELIDLINLIVNNIPSDKGWFFWIRRGWSVAKSIIAIIKEWRNRKALEKEELSRKVAQMVKV